MPGSDAARPDLAAMLQPLTQALIDAELPVLAAHGISMWEYVVLGALDGGPVRTQAALAEQIGADKTRIIAALDRLQAAGLISREPDPRDRRVRQLAITPAGHELRASVQAGIQAGEERLLARLRPADRAAFLRAARALAGLSRAELGRALTPARPDDRPCGRPGPPPVRPRPASRTRPS